MNAQSSGNRILALFLLTPILGFPQQPQPRAMLTVKGYSGQVPVIEINGKSYVDIESLARLTNGTVSFQANQVTLSFSAPGAPSTSIQADRPARLSKEFLKAAIEEMNVVSEWRTGLINTVQHNNPLTQEWADGYRRNADNKLSLASAAAVTEPDRALLVLLKGAFTNVQALSDKYVAMHNSQTFVAPDALDGDQLNRQIQSCADGLAPVISSSQFQDVPACH